MGWTWQRAKFYKPNGSIDRKAECDALCSWTNAKTGGHCEVLKSAMVGSTWYGACKLSLPDTEPIVFAGIFLTSVCKRDYYDFGYKDMDETVGPCQCNCPKSILDLLTPTDSEWANQWRETCRANIASKKDQRNSLLNGLPIGARICLVKASGEEVILEKGYVRIRTRPVWISFSENIFYPVKFVQRSKWRICE